MKNNEVNKIKKFILKEIKDLEINEIIYMDDCCQISSSVALERVLKFIKELQ